MRELYEFLTKYCGHWRSIGLNLGLPNDLLNMIQSDHPTQEGERFRIVLQKWLEQDIQATWSTLELAITNARRKELTLETLQESKAYFHTYNCMYMHTSVVICDIKMHGCVWPRKTCDIQVCYHISGFIDESNI